MSYISQSKANTLNVHWQSGRPEKEGDGNGRGGSRTAPTDAVVAPVGAVREPPQSVRELPLLPTDRPRPAVPSHRVASHAFAFSDLSHQIKALAREEGTTLYATLLTAFGVLLYRYTGQEEIAVGCDEWVGLPTTHGFGHNLVVWRADLSGQPTGQKLLGQVSQAVQEASSAVIGPEQSLPFQAMFIHHVPPLHLEGSEVSTTQWERMDLGQEIKPLVARVDLTLVVSETDDGLFASLVYNPDLFEPATVRRITRHFQTLLSGITANPQQRVSELPLLTETERHQLLVEWKNTQTDYPHFHCFHQLFSEQVERTPDAVAIITAPMLGKRLTYRELNERANQLAHYLIKLGVGPEVLVGICIERSLEMVVGLLAILKAGGAYVPLDPHLPQERLAFMVSDSDVRVLLTSEKWRGRLAQIAPPAKGRQIVCLDTKWKVISQESNSNPVTSVKPDNLAYCIYTSGSTGKPKGVEICHQALVNFLHTMRQKPGLTDSDTLLAVTTISFDIAGLELYLPLLVGAKVVIASREITSSGQLLAKLIHDSGTTVMQATPATWYLLLAAGWKGNQGLKILCGGEALASELANQLVTKGASLWNMYGPTETTIWSTIYEVEPNRQDKADLAYRRKAPQGFGVGLPSPESAKEGRNAPEPIGRPIGNTQIYILDGNLQPVPIGVRGDLYIGGAGLARGYRNRKELTEERFIANRFFPPSIGPEGTPGREGSRRIYKTGDLARYLVDGNIEFLGRKDHQVKIRGFRIELSEIEAVLDQHPAVHRSVVVAQEGSDSISFGNKRLVAYVVPDTQSQSEQISSWPQVWNMPYSQAAPEPDPTFNISGWNDCYTGRPIPAQEMREWVEHTVERILSCQPKRVLEIGCGTGMLLFRIAPHCAHYCATDIADKALRHIERHLGPLEGRVALRQRAADILDFEPGEFDTVIINSVVQLFPSIDYLVKVLEQAVQVVKPGGYIFVGDVRSYPLLEAFHASVQLHQAPASLKKSQLRQRVAHQLNEEAQLTIDPAFFAALKQHLPQISHVQIQLRRGHYHNQMTRFRYDVILHVGKKSSSRPTMRCLDWQKDDLTLPIIRDVLVGSQPEMLSIKQVPNARLLAEVKLLELLSSDEGPATAGELRDALQQFKAVGIEPEAFWALSEQLPYTININWSGSEAKDCYDVVCQRHSCEPAFFSEKLNKRVKPWSAYANNPLQGQVTRKLELTLRRYLAERLPDYMMPAAFVTLSALPLTPNGKVNRRALPVPNKSNRALEVPFVAPRTPTEEIVAAVWQEILKVEKVGVHDNFLALGGHSLLATQIVSHIRQAFQAELPLPRFFESPTVAQLAERIDEIQITKNLQTLPNTSIDDREEIAL